MFVRKMVLRCVFACFLGWILVKAAKTQDVCINCVPVADCLVFNNLTSAEQKRWTADFACSHPKLEDGNDFAFQPYRRTKYICCPRMNSQDRGSIQTHMARTSSAKNTRSVDKYGTTLTPISNYNGRQTSENMWVNDQEDKSDYLVNGESRQNNDGYKNNDGNYDSQRAPSWQRRPNTHQFNNGQFQNPFGGNQFQNPFGGNQFQNPYGGNQFQNPYFMKNPNVQSPWNGVNRNGNAGTSNLGQCTGLTSFPPETNEGCCGRDVSDADRIIGGQTTELEEFPWTVLLNSKFTSDRNQAEFSCGGSLISSRYVLTAAHCLYDAASRLTGVEVFLAEYDKRTFPRDCRDSPGEGQRCVENIKMQAEDAILHPEYDDSRLQNDIALIRLRGTAPYTDFIRPICLPLINIDSPDFSNLPLSVAGWGRNGRFQSDVKQSTVVHLVLQRECKRHYPYLTKRHLCAAGHTGEDTCKGDSGGPLMTLHRGKYFVAGIVSGKRADTPCGSAVPSLYTNVYNYLDWIRSKIRN